MVPCGSYMSEFSANRDMKKAMFNFGVREIDWTGKWDAIPKFASLVKSTLLKEGGGSTGNNNTFKINNICQGN